MSRWRHAGRAGRDGGPRGRHYFPSRRRPRQNDRYGWVVGRWSGGGGEKPVAATLKFVKKKSKIRFKKKKTGEPITNENPTGKFLSCGQTNKSSVGGTGVVLVVVVVVGRCTAYRAQTATGAAAATDLRRRRRRFRLSLIIAFYSRDGSPRRAVYACATARPGRTVVRGGVLVTVRSHALGNYIFVFWQP